jgi:hypothetical protein
VGFCLAAVSTRINSVKGGNDETASAPAKPRPLAPPRQTLERTNEFSTDCTVHGCVIQTLMQILPKHRHPALKEELHSLSKMLVGLFVLPHDLTLAWIPDPQGLGAPQVSNFVVAAHAKNSFTSP